MSFLGQHRWHLGLLIVVLALSLLVVLDSVGIHLLAIAIPRLSPFRLRMEGYLKLSLGILGLYRLRHLRYRLILWRGFLLSCFTFNCWSGWGGSLAFIVVYARRWLGILLQLRVKEEVSCVKLATYFESKSSCGIIIPLGPAESLGFAEP